MNDFTRQTASVALALLGIVSALASVFFAYYTARLIYINLTMTDIAAHRSGGMYIGATAFPLAAIVFAASSLLCFKTARRLKFKEKE